MRGLCLFLGTATLSPVLGLRWCWGAWACEIPPQCFTQSLNVWELWSYLDENPHLRVFSPSLGMLGEDSSSSHHAWLKQRAGAPHRAPNQSRPQLQSRTKNFSMSKTWRKGRKKGGRGAPLPRPGTP